MHYPSALSCVLCVGVIGVSYKTADLNLREAIARAAQSLSDQRGLFFPHATVVLSTCNRTEIYFSDSNLAQVHSDLLAFFRTQIEEPFEHCLYSYFAIDCFMHLCRVSSGLESAILAETEIQRQVRVSYQRSKELFQLSSSLHYIFQKALKVGKTLRTEVEWQKGGPTLYGTLWQIAQREWGDVSNRKILLVGYSEIHRGWLSFLAHKGIKQVTLCTKQPETICLEGVIACDRRVLERWADYDWIVCASQAEEYLISGKSEKRHLIYDLSVPRNVDPEVVLNKGVKLLNIEQINCQIDQKKRAYQAYVQQCEEHLKQNVRRLARIYRQKTLRADLTRLEVAQRS